MPKTLRSLDIGQYHITGLWSRPLDDRTEIDVIKVLNQHHGATDENTEAEDGKCLHDICNKSSFCPCPVALLCMFTTHC
jgi:hypothetical protein